VARAYPVIVLAAGASSRMGSPKPLLDFDGVACLQLVLDACRDGGAQETIVVLGADADRVGGNLDPRPDLRLVVNGRPERGQTSSVKAGLEAVSPGSPGFFILPADHPLIEGPDLAILQARSEASPAGTSIWIPAFRGRRGHPVLFAASHREAILALEDRTPLRDYVRGREPAVEIVTAGNSGVVTGINTRAEYEAALAEMRRRRAARPTSAGDGATGPTLPGRDR
jgi:molybdenum cofactor cytidylyltransferase